MAKGKVCKKCKRFVEGDVCPICKGNQFTTNYNGRIIILDSRKSFIANEIGIPEKGRYVIKVR